MNTTATQITEELIKTHSDDLQDIQMYILYLKLSPDERAEFITAMKHRLESRLQESMEVYKSEPALLSGLSIPALRDVSLQTVEYAHKWILEKFPGVGDLLTSFECLTSFSMSRDEAISHAELSDVISSLKTIWNTVSTETPKEAGHRGTGAR